MKTKEYSDQSELLTAIVKFYFSREEFDQQIRAFLESEKADKLIEKIMNMFCEDKNLNRNQE